MPEEVKFGPVPRALRYASALGLLIGVVLIFAGGLRIGVTWDEPLHVEKFNTYLETGWYLNNGQVEDGEPTPSMSQQYVYAPATMVILHGLGAATGVEPWGAASTSADAYAVRHVGIGIISLVGIFAIACTTRLLLRRWDWALVSAGALATLPMWTGHSMFNLKDVPVATGYALVTLGLAIVARRQRAGSWAIRIGGPVTLACGAFLAVGTRPGMWTGIFGSIVILVLCWLLRRGDGSMLRRVTSDWWRYRDVAVGLALTLVGLVALYPRVFDSPLQVLWHAAFSSANFLGDHAPWTFVPVRVFLQLPFIMLGFVGLGVFFLVRRLFAVRFRPEVFETRAALLAVQTFAMPLIAIVHGASLYGDLRQLLFAAPSTMVIGTVGMARLTEISRRSSDKRGLPMVAAVTSVAIAAPLVDQATLFPYDYAYYNPLVAVARLPTDGEYYRGSGRELAPHIPSEGRLVCSPQIDKDGRAMRLAHLDGWVDCASALSSPISAYASQRRGREVHLAPDEFLVVTFDPTGRVPSSCERITQISRRAIVRRLYLATLSRCKRDYPVLSTKLVRISSESYPSLDFPDLGWLIPGNDGTSVGTRASGGVATMTFRLAEDFAGHAVRLFVGTTRGSDAIVTFGGTRLPVRKATRPAGLEMTIEPDLVDRAIAEPQSLAFRSRGAGPLDLKVFSLQAESSGS